MKKQFPQICIMVILCAMLVFVAGTAVALDEVHYSFSNQNNSGEVQYYSHEITLSRQTSLVFTLKSDDFQDISEEDEDYYYYFYDSMIAINHLDCGENTINIVSVWVRAGEEAVSDPIKLEAGTYTIHVSCNSRSTGYTLDIDGDYLPSVTAEGSHYMVVGQKVPAEIYCPKGLTYTWESSNESVAVVSADDEITALSEGYTYITCTFSDGNHFLFYTEVYRPYTDYESLSLNVGANQSIYFEGLENYYEAAITCQSGNEKIVTAAIDGQVCCISAISPGTVTVTITFNNAYVLSIPVTVNTMVFNPSTLTVSIGEISSIELLNTDIESKNITWVSSNPSIADVKRVDSYYVYSENPSISAEVYGYGSGNAVISAIYGDTTLASLNVIVRHPSINTATFTLGAGKTKKLSINNLKNDFDPVIEWKSANKKIATVDSNGTVKGKSQGTTTITARINGNTDVTAKVTVRISIASKKTVAVGESITLKVTGAKKKDKITWKSSNPNIVKVSKKGVITAGNKTGKATITAKVGKKKLKCKVTVKPKVEITVDYISDVMIFNDVSLSFHNYSSKKVVYVRFTIAQYDNAGKPLKSPYREYFLNDDIAPHGEYNGLICWTNDLTKKVKVTIREVTFSDGSKWRP